MRILVFQHAACEHPGVFRDFLAEDGIAYDAVELDAGESIPALDRYDALWVMGGPMDVWEEAEHPWLTAEKAAIRDAVLARKMPYFGLCLGHQLLGAALGAKVGPMPKPEVGILSVDLTEEGRKDPLMAGLPSRQNVLQWHGAAVLELPKGAVSLAASPPCPIQAMRVGANAYGLQYHMEMTDRTIDEWSRIPAYSAALDATLGAGAVARLDRETGKLMPEFNAMARRIYDNFMQRVVPLA
jgi:GMP synthase-like glutamine amidotransferase